MEEKTYHLTSEGFQKYKEEFKKLKENLREKKLKLKELRDEIWKPEDLNPDYEIIESEIISAEIKLKELENILKNSKSIRKRNQKAAKITIGSRVITQTKKTTEKFIIVETIEANPSNGKISKESPVGKAFLGKKIGDIVIVSFPQKTTYKIKNIT
ncbi:MAG: GreA/GreB family elongation factor [Candidatus Pacebacteria bacterium]|nr:GreA/GreB family elongation factor [Candidatus Paceibacterota bacterium]